MSVKFYKRLIVVIYTLILLIPTVVIGVIAFDFKNGLEESKLALAQYSDVIMVNQTTIGKSGVMEVYQADGKMKPLVILQHAINTSRKDVIKSAYKFAESGYFVVAPDLYAHGDRVMVDSRELAMQGAVYTSESYDDIIEYYLYDDRCDSEKFGLVGYSLGGMVAFHYATYGTYKPTVLAPCIATPDWEALSETYLYKTIIPTGDEDFAEDAEKVEKADQVLLDNSPMNEFLNLKDVHILMQNGATDRTISSEGVTKLYHLLSPMGADITLMIHQSQGHIVPDNNIDNIIDFLDKNLK